MEIQRTERKLRSMPVTLYQQGTDSEHLIERHENELVADIVDVYSQDEKILEIIRMPRIVKMSDRRGGRLLLTHTYSEAVIQTPRHQQRYEVPRKKHRK